MHEGNKMLIKSVEAKAINETPDYLEGDVTYEMLHQSNDLDLTISLHLDELNYIKRKLHEDVARNRGYFNILEYLLKLQRPDLFTGIMSKPIDEIVKKAYPQNFI